MQKTITHQTVDFHIKGLTPLMLHNGNLADPLNPYSKAMKVLTSKKNKTDDDYMTLYDLEWEGGLYLDAERRPIFPSDNIEGAFCDAAAKQKKKQDARAGLLCMEDSPIIHNGPKVFEKLKADPRFRDKRTIPVNGGRVVRCRPIFMPWELKFTIHYLPDILNKSQVEQWAADIGRIIGIGEYTPKYGRFHVA